MKTTIKKTVYLAFIVFSFMLQSCVSTHSDETYFNGELTTVEQGQCISKEVPSFDLPLEGLYYGIPAVYDSLLFFYNSKLKDKTFNVNNTNTLQEIGTFCERGNGPSEAVVFSPIFYFFEKSGELKTHLFAPNEGKLFQWNITRSIQDGCTSYDTIVPCSFRDKKNNAFYRNVFFLSSDTLIAQIATLPIGEDDATLPYYQVFKVGTEEVIEEYHTFKKSIKNENARILPELFFDTYSALKPDKSKLVEAMRNIPQINIVDLKTGVVKGFRLKDGDDFSVFTKENKELKIYFSNLAVDDDYIYAVYYGQERPKAGEAYNANTIYVFNWDGELRYRLTTDCQILETALDAVNNRLYMTVVGKDEVRYLDLNNILK